MAYLWLVEAGLDVYKAGALGTLGAYPMLPYPALLGYLGSSHS